MTEATPFQRKYDITFLCPPTIREVRFLRLTAGGTDVHNQPKIYIRNPADGSHISPHICRHDASSIG